MGSYKSRRKLSKYKQILKSEFNIDFKDEPSKNIMIGNAGLVSGISYEQLASLFTQFGSVEEIVMIPNKSYSFVVYSTIKDAEKAHDAINGQLKLDKMDGPIYLMYTTSVPSDFNLAKSNTMPKGLTLLNDFISFEEEEKLMSCINWDPAAQVTGKTLKHRRVKHFGYEFRYDNNNVDKDSPLEESIPEECSFIPTRLQEIGHPLPWTPNQLTVNQYQRGQGIPSHIDTHSAFAAPLLSLSLGSDVVMDFRRGSEHVSVLLPRRSLLIMDGEARYTWTHGITPRTMDVVYVAGGLSVRDRACRTSFTLRRVNDGPCNCQYPTYCDSQLLPQPLIPDHEAAKLEELYVHKVYGKIASHFSETRTKIWPNVQEFLLSFTPGSILIDAGCGNGKYFGVHKNIYQVGFDRSLALAEITHSQGHEVFVSDCLFLPVRDETADGVISIAVLHHLATRKRRLQALQEITRVLVPGGKALVTVWAKNQTKENMTAYLKQDRKNRKKCYGESNIQHERPLHCAEDFSDCYGSKSYKGNTNHVKSSVSFSESDLLKVEQTEQSLNFKLPVHTARTEFQHQDVFVPWKVKSNEKDNSIFLRYYHVFEENELSQLCVTLQDIKILQTYYTEGNWCIILQKCNSSSR